MLRGGDTVQPVLDLRLLGERGPESVIPLGLRTPASFTENAFPYTNLEPLTAASTTNQTPPIPESKLEVAYHKAHTAIQDIVELLAAA